MARATSKSQLLDEIARERCELDDLLASIPPDRKLEEVTEGLSVKDLLAHRTEWDRMLLSWYDQAGAGAHPAVPSAQFKRYQLPELNAQIQRRFVDAPLERVETDFVEVHDRLSAVVETMTEHELFGASVHPFTGSTTLAASVTSAPAAHYRSAAKLIRRWWKAPQASGTSG